MFVVIFGIDIQLKLN